MSDKKPIRNSTAEFLIFSAPFGDDDLDSVGGLFEDLFRMVEKGAIG